MLNKSQTGNAPLKHVTGKGHGLRHIQTWWKAFSRLCSDQRVCQQLTGFESIHYLLSFVSSPVFSPSLASNTGAGISALTGALPSGRKAGMTLADGSVSASPGSDKDGPTALMKSASRAIDTVKYFSSLLNMKFHPTPLSTAEGLKKLIALIKTYMDLGGHHVQFNVVSAKTLRDAQIHPENYKDLIVRVAGFSAYFIYLDPVIQNEIISRTELNFRN